MPKKKTTTTKARQAQIKRMLKQTASDSKHFKSTLAKIDKAQKAMKAAKKKTKKKAEKKTMTKTSPSMHARNVKANLEAKKAEKAAMTSTVGEAFGKPGIQLREAFGLEGIQLREYMKVLDKAAESVTGRFAKRRSPSSTVGKAGKDMETRRRKKAKKDY